MNAFADYVSECVPLEVRKKIQLVIRILRVSYFQRSCDNPVLAPDAPDAAVRIFDSVGAGSGN